MASRLRVAAYTISLDGFGAGPRQTREAPLGVGGESLHGWLVDTHTFHSVTGRDGGSTGVDDAFAARSFENVGSWIMGRNMFGPVRGPWPDESWRGWWGENPVYHCPIYVLTHHARAPLVMEGGTTFHFVTGGIGEALQRARESAAGRDVRIGGGASTIRQYLEAGLVDEMHLAISPVMLGSGEPLFAGLGHAALDFEVVEHVPTGAATHVVLRKR